VKKHFLSGGMGAVYIIDCFQGPRVGFHLVTKLSTRVYGQGAAESVVLESLSKHLQYIGTERTICLCSVPG
jgi:hypothetical protein